MRWVWRTASRVSCLSGTGQVTRFLGGLLRHEAGGDQAVSQEFGQPLGVVDVGFPAGHLLNMHWVGQDQVQAVLQGVPDRLPIDAGRFHDDVGDAGLLQPGPEAHQFSDRGA